MSSLEHDRVADVRAVSVSVTADTLTVELLDGRTVSAPLAWYPRLVHGTPAERTHWRLIGDDQGIHWADLDEDIDVEQLVSGQSSGETQESLKQWVETRQASKA